ncbi:hypothetical protein L1887_02731 [Cichorium endivia]|nr:hypothetical protein L1887_02731 [Cichorium endivia]
MEVSLLWLSLWKPGGGTLPSFHALNNSPVKSIGNSVVRGWRWTRRDVDDSRRVGWVFENPTVVGCNGRWEMDGGRKFLMLDGGWHMDPPEDGRRLAGLLFLRKKVKILGLAISSSYIMLAISS